MSYDILSEIETNSPSRSSLQTLVNRVVDATKSGDHIRRDHLFDDVHALSYKFVQAIVRGSVRPDDVEDIVCEIFVDFFLALVKGKPVHNARALLRRIAKLRCIDYYRARKGKLPEDHPADFCEILSESKDDGPHAVSTTEWAEDPARQLIRAEDNSAMLMSLPEPTRSVIEARYLYGLSVEESSSFLGLKIDVIKKHTGRGLTALKTQELQRGLP